MQHDEEQMAILRKKMGYKGTAAEFREFLLTDPQFIAKTPEEFRDRLVSYVERIEPKVPLFFCTFPKPDTRRRGSRQRSNLPIPSDCMFRLQGGKRPEFTISTDHI